MELANLIIRDFADLIRAYDLTIFAPFPSIVRLENEHCIIKVQREMGIEVYITFTNKITSKEYGLMSLIVYYNLDDKLKAINSKGGMDFYAILFETYFTHILKGDFSWSSDYDEFMKRYTG